MLLLRAEIMCLVRIVYYSEAITSRINVLIRNNLVSDNINVTLDFRFLNKIISIAPFMIKVG